MIDMQKNSCFFHSGKKQSMTEERTNTFSPCYFFNRSAQENAAQIGNSFLLASTSDSSSTDYLCYLYQLSRSLRWNRSQFDLFINSTEC